MRIIGIVRGAAMVATILCGCFSSAHADWVDGQNASFVIGQPDFTSSGGAVTQNRLGARPTAVAVDFRHNKIYVADYSNHRVLRFSYPVIANQPDAEAVLGQVGFSSNASATTRSGLAGARDVAVDAFGSLWLADAENDRVLVFDLAATLGNGPESEAVLGQSNFTSNLNATAQDRLFNPNGLAIDASGSLYVADRDNHRVMIFEEAWSKIDGADAEHVLGQTTFTANASGTTQSTMTSPLGLAVNQTGDTLLVADGNGRVIVFGDGLPSAPVALDATNRSSSAFTANWNRAEGAQRYLLDVSTSIDFSSFVSGYQNRVVTDISQRVSGLSSVRTYYYRVRADNAGGTSPYSNRVSATTTGLSASSTCFINALLDWFGEP
jgi:sugar lactone lactonase YvrE